MVLRSEEHSIQVLTGFTVKEACRELRTVLKDEGLEVGEELNISRKIHDHTGLVSPEYVIVDVWSPLATRQALLAMPEAGVFVPFHLVVASREAQTLVMAVDPDWLAQIVDRLCFRVLVNDLFERLKRALARLEEPRIARSELNRPSDSHAGDVQ